MKKYIFRMLICLLAISALFAVKPMPAAML